MAHYKKWYVKSGELELIQEASTPEKACFLALCRFNNINPNGQLDPFFFYVDQRGHRQPVREENGSLLCLPDNDCLPEFTIATQKVLDMLEDK